MDESFQEFEVELKGLAPRRIDPQLMDRIAIELAAPAGQVLTRPKNDVIRGNHFVAWRWISVGAAGIAAALAIFVNVSRRPARESQAGSAPGAIVKTSSNSIAGAERATMENAYKPIAAANVLYEMKDEGPVPNEGDSAERRVRYRYVDTYTWKNPRNNASLTWSVPRDEIRVQSVQFN